MDWKAIIGSVMKPRSRRAEQAGEQLRANADKALRMKNAAQESHIPPHRTAHGGMRDTSSRDRDHTPAREGSFTPEVKRSKVARSGDTS